MSLVLLIVVAIFALLGWGFAILGGAIENAAVVFLSAVLTTIAITGTHALTAETIRQEYRQLECLEDGGWWSEKPITVDGEPVHCLTEKPTARDTQGEI